jgi:hypothetical protein
LAEIQYKVSVKRPTDLKPTVLYEASITVTDDRDNPKPEIGVERGLDPSEWESFFKPVAVRR